MFAIRVLASLAMVAGLASAASAEPSKIRINWSVAPAHITPMINEVPKSIYKSYGKTYTVETIRMRGSGPALTALAAGEVDIGAVNNQAYALGIVNGKQDIVAIASVLRDAGKDPSNGFWVRKDSGISSVKDLEGKRIAVNALGSGVHASAKKMLLDHGLQPGKNYQFVEVRFGAMLSSLQTKRIDMGFLVLPFNFMAERDGSYSQLFTMRDSMGEQETVLWIAKRDYVAKNRAALIDFLADHIRMRQWAYDAKNRQAAAEIIGKIMRRPAKNYASWVFTDRDYGRTIDASFSPARLQKNVDDLHRLGVTPGTLDVSKYSDTTLTADAKKQAGM